MQPPPTIGSLAFHVYPPSSEIAMMPNEKPSEYIGTRIRPEGSSSGCVRVNHPMREKYSSLACSTHLASAGLSPAQVFVSGPILFGTRTMLSCMFHFGGPLVCW